MREKLKALVSSMTDAEFDMFAARLAALSGKDFEALEELVSELEGVTT